MSGGKVVAWVSKDDPMFRNDWRATTPLVYSDEHYAAARGPMVGLVLATDLAAAIARAEAAEALIGVLLRAIAPFGNAHMPTEREQLGDDQYQAAMHAMLAAASFLHPPKAIAAQQAEGES